MPLQEWTWQQWRRRADRWLSGPYPRLPGPLDAISERWAALRPRSRTVVALSCALLAATGVGLRVHAVDARWGGAPLPALVAVEDLPVGAEPAGRLRSVRWPPDTVPPGAVTDLPDGAVLAFALPAGAVLTEAHLEQRGAAAGLPSDLRAVPIPVESGWQIVAGGWVDVWVLGPPEAPAMLIATSRPVLEVRASPTGVAATALVGLHVDEVAAVTQGLGSGSVLLTHAPAP